MAAVFAEIGPWGLAALYLAIACGAAAQRLGGQGYGMIAAPAMALIAPTHLPATLLLLGLAIGGAALSMDRRAIVWGEAVPGFVGRALGALAGAALAASLAGDPRFETAIALVILAAVGLSLSGVTAPIRATTLALAGLAAGIMGTLTAIGAPPMALLYQNAPAVKSRAMQNLFYLWGMFWSIGALGALGLIGWGDAALALALVPAAVLGLAIARPLAARMAARSIRPVTLSFATIAALILLGRSLL